ncbi:MAG: PTS sugar transporter subunit IIC [Peptoniphilaceae bacterium]|nr:PTS sugar transporter subunit IIC [Peptoniphilaceae bacterium]
MEGVLDQFQFHQPIVACTLIGLVTGHLKEGIILGGSLQMIALGRANVGAAMAHLMQPLHPLHLQLYLF